MLVLSNGLTTITSVYEVSFIFGVVMSKSIVKLCAVMPFFMGVLFVSSSFGKVHLNHGILVGKNVEKGAVEVLLQDGRGVRLQVDNPSNEAMLQKIRGLIVTNLVEVSWRDSGGDSKKILIDIKMVKPRVKPGLITGEVVRKVKNGFDLKVSSSGEVIRFIPQWYGGMPKSGGGLDREVLAQIRPLKVGDVITIEWVYAERPRVLKVVR